MPDVAQIEVSTGSVADLQAAPRLLEQHYAETALNPRDPVAVDWDLYLAMERAGVLMVTVVRNGPDLVGYAVTVSQPDLLHAGRRSLVVHHIYADPLSGPVYAGPLLIAAIRRRARAGHFDRILWAARPGSWWAGVLDRRCLRIVENYYEEPIRG